MITFQSLWPEKQLAVRVAEIVHGLHSHLLSFKPYENKDTWVLDNGNDWWLKPMGDNTYELHYRYERSIAPAIWNAFTVILEWQVGLSERDKLKLAEKKADIKAVPIVASSEEIGIVNSPDEILEYDEQNQKMTRCTVK